MSEVERTVETNRLGFLWEQFVTERRGAIEQVIHFIEQQGFIVPLRGFLDDGEIMDVHTADIDLRMPPEAPPSNLITIEVGEQHDRRNK